MTTKTRLERALAALKWQGGTIHQVNDELNIDVLNLTEEHFNYVLSNIDFVGKTFSIPKGSNRPFKIEKYDASSGTYAYRYKDFNLIFNDLEPFELSFGLRQGAIKLHEGV